MKFQLRKTHSFALLLTTLKYRKIFLYFFGPFSLQNLPLAVLCCETIQSKSLFSSHVGCSSKCRSRRFGAFGVTGIPALRRSQSFHGLRRSKSPRFPWLGVPFPAFPTEEFAKNCCHVATHMSMSLHIYSLETIIAVVCLFLCFSVLC